MKTFTVEMAYGLGLSMAVQANTEEEAIKKAKEKADNMTIVSFDIDVGCREVEEITYVKEC